MNSGRCEVAFHNHIMQRCPRVPHQSKAYWNYLYWFQFSSYFFLLLLLFSFRIWNIPEHLPSAGLIAYTVASTFCDKISLFGFYPYLTDCNKKELQYHYYDKLKGGSLHKMPREHDIYKDLHKLRYIKLMTGGC